jgi:hypothetical protein
VGNISQWWELLKKRRYVKTYDLSGNYDNEKLEREKIRAEIRDKVSAKLIKRLGRLKTYSIFVL